MSWHAKVHRDKTTHLGGSNHWLGLIRKFVGRSEKTHNGLTCQGSSSIDDPPMQVKPLICVSSRSLEVGHKRSTMAWHAKVGRVKTTHITTRFVLLVQLLVAACNGHLYNAKKEPVNNAMIYLYNDVKGQPIKHIIPLLWPLTMHRSPWWWWVYTGGSWAPRGRRCRTCRVTRATAPPEGTGTPRPPPLLGGGCTCSHRPHDKRGTAMQQICFATEAELGKKFKNCRSK